jgi:hypothetical protein
MRTILAAVVLTVAVGAGAFAWWHSGRIDPVRDFSTSLKLDAGTNATANVSLGDLDGDGDLDIVLARGRHWGDVDLVLLNDGKGHFTTRDLGPAKDSSYSALLADVEGDGDLDVIVSNDSESGRVYLNDGKAIFKETSQWGNANWPTRNAVSSDLNGDARPDVVAANRSPRDGRRSEVCLNDGRGLFTACTELAAIGPATTIVAADFDRDGHVDLAVPHRDGGQSLILHNDGKGGFTKTTPFGPATTAARAAAAGDLNNDGWPDLVVGDENISTFVFLNDGHGGLTAGLQLKLDSLPTPFSIAIGDLNRDDSPDIVVGYSGDRGSVFFNDGTGRSFRHVRFGDTDGAVYGLAIGDLDGDRWPDIVAARNGAPNVVYFNRAGLGVDTVSTTDPRVKPSDPDRARIGTWSGVSTYSLGYHWDVRFQLDELKIGALAGRAHRDSNGVAYCDTILTFKERRPDGTFIFASRGVEGCTYLDETVEARWIDDDHVQWSARGPNGAPATATLARQPGKVQATVFEGVLRDAATPALGTWRGQGRMANDPADIWSLELQIERLRAGEPVGRWVRFMPSPTGTGDLAFCPARLTLKEQKPDGAFVISQISERVACGDDEFQIRMVDGDRLQIEWFWSGQPKPDAKGILERKPIRRPDATAPSSARGKR